MHSDVFFFTAAAATDIYTLSLHDALPISAQSRSSGPTPASSYARTAIDSLKPRSEEHTSELQSLTNLVCRLLLEKKKKARVAGLSPGADVAGPPAASCSCPAGAVPFAVPH